MIQLKKLNFEDTNAEYEYIRSVLPDENGFFNDSFGVSYDVFVSQTLPTLINHSKGLDLPDGYVPETHYMLWDDGCIIGWFRLRHYLCESLAIGAGHVGYSIKETHRQRGYATKGLKLLINEASKIIPEDEIYLRVNKNNPASLSVMLKNGGYIHHEDNEKYYVRIRKEKMNIKDKITINAHSSVRIEDEKILRVDPYLLEDEPHDVDIIFVTHSHGDHFSPENIAKVKKENTVLVIPETILDTVINAGFSPDRIITVKPNETFEIEGYSVTAIPSYNTNKPMHKKEYNWVGYIITVGDSRVYIAGDTDATDELESLDCDVAIIPIGGTYTMNYEEAAAAINKMNPRTVIPSHYGSVVGGADSGEKFASLVKDGIEVCFKI